MTASDVIESLPQVLFILRREGEKSTKAPR